MWSLCFSTTDLAFQLNDGKFEYNRRCGYVVICVHSVAWHMTPNAGF